MDKIYGNTLATTMNPETLQKISAKKDLSNVDDTIVKEKAENAGILNDYYTSTQTDDLLNDKADKSEIPTKTSEIENDSDFITSSEITDLSDRIDGLNESKADKGTTLLEYGIEDAWTIDETKAYVDEKVPENGADDKVVTEKFERLKYYGNADTEPSDASYFNITKDGEISFKTEAKNNSSITEIVIPYEIDGIAVKKISAWGFENCSNLTSVKIPDSVTDIGNYTFSGCTNLTSITIPNGVTKIIWYVFNNCSSLTSITIPDSVTGIGSSAFNGCTNLTSITIPDSVTTISNSTFSGCTNLTSITIPDSVTTIDYDVFEDCSKDLTIICTQGSYADTFAKNNRIKVKYDIVSSGGGSGGAVSSVNGQTGDVTITASDLNAATVVEIGVMLSESLKNFSETLKEDFAKKDLSNVDDLDFLEKAAKAGVNGADITNASKLIERQVYYGDANIAPSDASYFSITEKGEISFTTEAKNNSSITEIVIPYEIDGMAVKSIAKLGFTQSSNLTSVIIPNSITSVGMNAFVLCSSLTSVTIPNSITAMGMGMFNQCSSLASVIIPDSVTEIKTNALTDCSNLTSIKIPDSVTTIAENALNGCHEDLTIICKQGSYADTFAKGKGFNVDYNFEISNGDVALKDLSNVGNDAFLTKLNEVLPDGDEVSY